MELGGVAEHLREGASLFASGSLLSALGSSRASRHRRRTTRDGIGRTTLATLTSSAATVNETATYNGFGEPKTQKTCSGGTGTTCTGGTTFYEVTSTTRDKLGRITALTETTAIPGGPGASTVAWGYSYDEAGRLKTVDKTSAAQIAYTYDANGNRLTATGGEVITTGTIDGQDRLASQTRAGVTTAYTYTNNGSMLTSTSPTAAWTYAYDLQENSGECNEERDEHQVPGGRSKSPRGEDGYGGDVAREIRLRRPASHRGRARRDERRADARLRVRREVERAGAGVPAGTGNPLAGEDVPAS